jgi:GMP synthase (glutamine-hydrolysing)
MVLLHRGMHRTVQLRADWLLADAETTMRKVLVCQHVPHEPLGILDPLLRERRFRIRYINFGRHPHEVPDLAGYDALVVLGGPMNVDETARHPHLMTELRLLEQAMARDLPVLGICLGAQLMAKALGAEVSKNPQREIGWYDLQLTPEGQADPVLSRLGHNRVFQWHGDTFAIPTGAVQLARAETCEAQAFRYGNHAYALQFHLEVDAPTIGRWIRINAGELSDGRGHFDVPAILQETDDRIDTAMDTGRCVFDAMLSHWGWKGRQRVGLCCQQSG